jgi:hypothetical protein
MQSRACEATEKKPTHLHLDEMIGETVSEKSLQKFEKFRSWWKGHLDGEIRLKAALNASEGQC